jgi:hypothetical protein
MQRALLIIAILFAFTATAQTPAPRPDIVLLQAGGIYPIKCVAPSDEDMAQICFVRTDLAEVVELGCTGAEALETVSLDLNIVATAGDDAEIRCYAVDASGLVGDYSENAGLVDFTRPGRPYVQ